jgi:hypothetical protein
MHMRKVMKQLGTRVCAIAAFHGCIFLLVAAMPLDAVAGTPDSLHASAKPVAWSFSLAGYYYALPKDKDIPLGVATGDYGDLHLEARYNYEDFRTGSVFAGWTLSMGESVAIALTPMAGVAFGETSGVVPALEASLEYDILDFYSETEYLIDVQDQAGNFLYTWLELGVAPNDLFRIGFTAQRLWTVESNFELDRGVFAQVRPAPGVVSVYAFNLFTGNWFIVAGLEYAW